MIGNHDLGPHRIELNADALRHNLQLFRTILNDDTLIAAVVKANAYGHGIRELAPMAARLADWLAVHSASEARVIRGLCVDVPVLIMGFVPASDLHDLDADTHVFASTEEVLGWLGDYRRETGISLPVHLKVDTGTNRQGVGMETIPSLCRAAAREGLTVVGVATHFANIEDTLEHHFARRQLEQFHRAVELTREELGEDPPLIHAACSAAALLFPQTDFNIARIGISMYGHWPSRETKLTWILDHGRNGLKLEPVLRWRTVVGQVKEVEKGATVGYGRTWTALRRTRLAVLPVGYSDGYPRILGNRSRVLVHDRPVPIVGRVCMNVMMVDVSDVEGVAVGDEVVLVGRQGDTEVTIEELAELSGTINYEFLARISGAIPRVVVGGTGEEP
jgi:alanine racemase